MWFLPIAVAFHAKYEPYDSGEGERERESGCEGGRVGEELTDGSHWKRNGMSSSYPAINNDTPNGRTPLCV